MKKFNQPIFIVEDDQTYALILHFNLKQMGYNNVQIFHDSKELYQNLHRKPFLILLDINLGQEENGVEILKEVKSISPDIEILMLSGQEDLECAIETLKLGALDYIAKGDNVKSRLEYNLEKIDHIAELIKHRAKRATRKTVSYTHLTLPTIA